VIFAMVQQPLSELEAEPRASFHASQSITRLPMQQSHAAAAAAFERRCRDSDI